MQKLNHVLSTTQFADRELLEHLFAMAQNMERDDQFRALPQRLRGRILATTPRVPLGQRYSPRENA